MEKRRLKASGGIGNTIGKNEPDSFGSANAPLQRKAQARSRLSNGRDLLPNVDGRSLVARRYRDILSAIEADQGGVDRLSEVRLQLIRRFAATACLAEQLEARLARNEAIEIEEYSLLVSVMVRVATRIGLDRLPRDVVPSVSQYLEQGAAT